MSRLRGWKERSTRSLLQGLAVTVWLVGVYEEASAAPHLVQDLALRVESHPVRDMPAGVGEQVGPEEPEAPAAIVRAGRPGQGAGVERPVQLPDLQTLPPADMEIQVERDGGRALRLTNVIWNSGAGPLEVIGEFNRATRRTQVRQRVYEPAQESNRPFQEIPVGEFVWHPTHDHWHMEDFAVYALWSLSASGGLDRVVSSSDKLSYCLMDTDVIDPHNPAYLPRRRYYACDRTLQGLSAGWGDKYKAHLDGQSLDLSGVRDGFYALVSTANPTGILVEENTNNNTAMVYLEIRGSGLAVISAEELSERRCVENGWC